MSAPQCCGLCHQGRRLCPTPEACRVPAKTAPGDAADALAALATYIVVTAAIAAAAAVMVFYVGTAS